MDFPVERMRLPASRPLRAIIHGLALAFIDILAVLGGFAVYHVAARPLNQIAVQVPVAAFLTLLGFALWCHLFRRAESLKRLAPRGGWDMARIYLGSLVFGPLIFTPLHYLGRGYLTSPENLINLWAFQAGVNLVVVLWVCRKPRA